MPYTPQTWVNAEDGTTPFSAPRMNYIEAGIETAQQTAEDALAAGGGGGGGSATFSGALVYRAADYTIPGGNTNFAVPWDTEQYDVGGWWALSPNPTRLTVPAGITRVWLRANLRYKSGTTGGRALTINKNGTFLPGGGQTVAAASNGYTVTSLNASSGALVVTPGDYFEVVGNASQGSQSLDGTGTHCWFAIEAWA